MGDKVGDDDGTSRTNHALPGTIVPSPVMSVFQLSLQRTNA